MAFAKRQHSGSEAGLLKRSEQQQFQVHSHRNCGRKRTPRHVAQWNWTRSRSLDVSGHARVLGESSTTSCDESCMPPKIEETAMPKDWNGCLTLCVWRWSGSRSAEGQMCWRMRRLAAAAACPDSGHRQGRADLGARARFSGISWRSAGASWPPDRPGKGCRG
jgi:hypothetical protein